MDDSAQILVALGASVAANCRPCLEHYLDRAAEVGLRTDEIHDAVAVGQKVARGAAAKMRQFTASTLAVRDTPSPAREAGCGCSGC